MPVEETVQSKQGGLVIPKGTAPVDNNKTGSFYLIIPETIHSAPLGPVTPGSPPWISIRGIPNAVHASGSEDMDFLLSGGRLTPALIKRMAEPFEDKKWSKGK